MQRIFVFLFSLLSAELLFAQSNSIYCISTAPGEDASVQMRVSWATDTTQTGSAVLYTLESDTSWKDALTVPAMEEYRCDLFDGKMYEKADGTVATAGVIFTKCGTSLIGLHPDTNYKYVIQTAEGQKSTVHHFRTAGARKWSACIISDFHSWLTRPVRIESAMGLLDTVCNVDPSVDFILSPGDLVAFGGCYYLWQRLFERPIFEKYMWARANGNHDNWDMETPKEQRSDIPNNFFPATSYFPHNGYAGQEGVCYHFRYGNTMFVMVNSEDISPDKPGELDAARNWVRSVVTQERRGVNPPTFVVVCMHYEWFKGVNGKDFQHKHWGRLFDEIGVDVAIAGNNHAYMRSHRLFGGKVVDKKDGRGTLYLVNPASDNDRGRAVSEEESFNDELIARRWSEGKHTVAGIHMSVDDKQMTFTLIDREGKTIDSCTVNAVKYNK